MNCESFSSDLHAHDKGFFDVKEEMSDAQKQLEKERFEAEAEKNIRAMNGSGKTSGNRSTTFNPVNRPMNNTTYSTPHTPKNVNTTVIRQYASQQDAQNKTKKTLTLVIVLIFVFSLLFTFIPGIIIAFTQSHSSDNSPGFIDESKYFYENQQPDIKDDINHMLFETIYTEDYEITFFEPRILDVTPLEIDANFSANSNYDSYGDWYVLEVPVLVTNTSDKILFPAILGINVKVESTHENNTTSAIRGKTLSPSEVRKNINAGESSVFSYYYAVKKSDLYKIRFTSIDNSSDEYVIAYEPDETYGEEDDSDEIYDSEKE